MVGQNHKSDGFDRRRFITRANAEVWHPFRMHCLRHPLPVVIPGKRRNDHRLPSVNPPGKEHRAARCRDISGDGGNKFGTTALRLGLFGGRQPRVARSSQSWALRQNPFGIQKGRVASTRFLPRHSFSEGEDKIKRHFPTGFQPQ